MIREDSYPYGKKIGFVTKFVKFRNVMGKELPKKVERGAFMKKGGTNSNQTHLGLPGSSNRRWCLLVEAT